MPSITLEAEENQHYITRVLDVVAKEQLSVNGKVDSIRSQNTVQQKKKSFSHSDDSRRF